MSNAVAPSVLLDCVALATELCISKSEAKRLVAKRLLPATQIGGAEGDFRVTRGALESYVQKGAPDVRMPGEYAPDHDWFSDDLRSLSEGFYGAVIAAAAQQVPSEEAIRANFEADLRSTTLDFQISNAGAVAAALSQPVPVSIYTPADARTDSRFSRWADVYAVDLLRRVARQVISGRNLLASPFDVLYESLQSFQAIVDEAYADAARRRIVWSKTYVWAGGPFGEIPVQRRASFLFGLAALFTPANKAKLLGLAF